MPKKVEIYIDQNSEYGWGNGEAYADHLSRAATYSKDSNNIDIYRSPGYLSSGFGFSTGSGLPGITSYITAFLRYLPNSRRAFLMDGSSNIAVVDLENLNASYIRALNASVYTNGDVGLEIHGDNLFAAYNVNASLARLSALSGLSNLPTATWNLSFNVSLLARPLNTQSNGTDLQVKHPLQSWMGRLYVMNGNRVDWTLGTTAGFLTNGCVLPENMIIKTCVPFGNRLAIGASSNLFDASYAAKTSVFLYDGISADWDREITFPDFDITNLEVGAEGELIGFGPNGIFAFDGDGFGRIEDIGDGPTVFHRSTDVLEGRLWFKGANVVRTYGRKSLQAGNKGFSTPAGGLPNGEGIVRFTRKTKMLVGGNGYVTQPYLVDSAAVEHESNWYSRWFGMKEFRGKKFVPTLVGGNWNNMVSGCNPTIFIVDETNQEWEVAVLSGASFSSVFRYGFELPASQFKNGIPAGRRMRLRVRIGGPRRTEFSSLNVVLEEVDGQE